jgi:hypothetical protein
MNTAQKLRNKLLTLILSPKSTYSNQKGTRPRISSGPRR